MIKNAMNAIIKAMMPREKNSITEISCSHVALASPAIGSLAAGIIHANNS